MNSSQDRAAARRAKAAAVIARDRARNRRRRIAFWVVIALVVAAAGAGVAVVIGGAVARQQQTQQAAAADIQGVKTYSNLSRNHVQDATYPQNPGVGGDHAPVWTNCKVYTSPVNTPQAVHSLEHGAAWITYRPDLAADQVRRLTDLASGKGYLLVSPNADQAAAVKATAWGVQLSVDSAADPRLPVFIQKYMQGPQTPEPGAACTGGVDG